MSVQFEYFYGSQAEQFSFYRIPKVLFTDEAFADISVEAKVLYSFMLDRMSLSVKNCWFDDDNRVLQSYSHTYKQSEWLAAAKISRYVQHDIEGSSIIKASIALSDCIHFQNSVKVKTSAYGDLDRIPKMNLW